MSESQAMRFHWVALSWETHSTHVKTRLVLTIVEISHVWVVEISCSFTRHRHSFKFALDHDWVKGRMKYGNEPGTRSSSLALRG